MNFLGVGSGLDLSSMLTGLVQVASEPRVNNIARKEVRIEDSISGLGMLKSSLSDFKAASDALKDASLFDSMVPTLVQPESGSIVDVEAEDDAVAGGYDIKVNQLASGSQLQTNWRSVKYQSAVVSDDSNPLAGNAGRLSFSIDGGAAIDLDLTGTESLSDIATAINGLSGISASVVDGRLEYSADGLSEALTVTASDGGGGAAASEFNVFTTAGGMDKKAHSSKDLDAALAGEILTFQADGQTFSYTFTGSESLESLAAAINNADDNFGVTANVVDGQLVYKSSITGAGNDLSVTGSSASADSFSTAAFGGGSGDVSATINAADAIITVDGISISNNSNTFDNAVSGLKITATKESVDNNGVLESASLSVGANSSDVKSKIEAFASSYNKLRERMNALHGDTDDKGKFSAGKLNNDPILRNVESVLNGLITKQVEGADSNRNTLYSVGLDIQDDGTLKVDGGRLSDAVNDDFSNLKLLFATGDGTSGGIADQVSDQIDNFVSFTGVIKGQEDSLNQQKERIEKEYEDLELYIKSYEDTLKQQFQALDSTMAQMNSTMAYVQSQLAALAR